MSTGDIHPPDVAILREIMSDLARRRWVRNIDAPQSRFAVRNEDKMARDMNIIGIARSIVGGYFRRASCPRHIDHSQPGRSVSNVSTATGYRYPHCLAGGIQVSDLAGRGGCRDVDDTHSLEVVGNVSIRAGNMNAQ